MTQLHKFRDAISNYFDRILAGLGKRGSSFSDIDAVTHDRDTQRFLVQEFKHERETEPNAAQQWILRDLAALPDHFTVWYVVKRDDGGIGFAPFGAEPRVITVQEYQARFAAWWAERPLRRSAAPQDVMWTEVARLDGTLRAFVDAEIARAGIELQTAKDNAEHWKGVALHLDAKLQQRQTKR